MSRNTIVVAFVSALGIAGIASAAFLGFFTSSDDAGRGGDSNSVSVRLAALEESASRQQLLLRSLESRLDSVGSTRKSGEAEDRETDAEETETETEGGMDGEQSGELVARIEDVERRIRSLEEDPVQRGYYYIESSNPELRRQGILSLERIAAHDPEARDTIRQMLEDPDHRVRWTALDTLADLNDKESAGLIAALLEDENVDVRSEAVNSLGRLGAKQNGPMLASMLTDESEKVRQRAADVLGDLKYEDAAPALIAALQDESGGVRREAIASLGNIGNRGAIAPLRAIYDENPADNRVRLAATLKRLGDTGPYQTELARLSGLATAGESEDARREAIRSLGYYMKEDAKGLLEQLRNDPSRSVRWEVSRALGEQRRR